MSYREILVKIKKNEAKKYMELSEESFLSMFNSNQEPDFFFSGFPYEIELSYLPEKIKDSDHEIKDFFKNFNIYKSMGIRYKIITKEKLKELIIKYQEEIINDFEEKIEYEKKVLKEIMQNNDKEPVSYLMSDLTIKKELWKNNYGCNPFYLMDDSGKNKEMILIERLEYKIFNFIFIYNTFDWENDFLLLKGC